MFHAAVLLWVAGLAHLLHGNVDTHAMAWLLVGSIPGVLIGSHMGIRVPERGLRVAFGVVLVLSGLKVADVPEAPLVISGAAGARHDRPGRVGHPLAARPPRGRPDGRAGAARDPRRTRRRIRRAVARVLSTAFLVALLAATAAAFALTEGAKLELSPIYQTKVDAGLLARAITNANIDFRLRKPIASRSG